MELVRKNLTDELDHVRDAQAKLTELNRHVNYLRNTVLHSGHGSALSLQHLNRLNETTERLGNHLAQRENDALERHRTLRSAEGCLKGGDT